MRCLIAGLMFVLIFWLASGQVGGDVTNGLVGRWELGSPTIDGKEIDSSGLGHDGTIHGTATVTPDRFGIANSALLFDRNSGYGYVSVLDSADLRPTNAITFTAWFNPTWFDLGNYSWPAVLKKSTYFNQGDGYAMETGAVYQSAPVMMSDMYTSGSGLTLSHLPISTDTWYFGAGVYDGSTLKFYLGQSDLRTLDVNSQNCSGTIQNSLGELWIGADPANPGSARSFNGAIDDVRIYNRALSADEINQVYTVTPEPSSLILLGAGAISLLAYVLRRRRHTM